MHYRSRKTSEGRFGSRQKVFLEVPDQLQPARLVSLTNSTKMMTKMRHSYWESDRAATSKTFRRCCGQRILLCIYRVHCKTPLQAIKMFRSATSQVARRAQFGSRGYVMNNYNTCNFWFCWPLCIQMIIGLYSKW